MPVDCLSPNELIFFMVALGLVYILWRILTGIKDKDSRPEILSLEGPAFKASSWW
jgi:hypothetical protein